LSLALSSLAGWCGLKVSRIGFTSSPPLRITAITYGAVVSLIGIFLFRQGIKKHFLEAYLHIAANVVFIALVSGLSGDTEWRYLGALISLAAASIVKGLRFRRFAFVVYGTVFGYIGLSVEALRDTSNFSAALLYVVVSGTAVITAMALLARRFGREE